MSISSQNWSKEVLKRRVRFAYGDSLASESRNDGNVPVFGSNGVVGTHDRSITCAPVIIIGRKGSAGRVTWSNVPCFPIDTTYFVDRTQTRENMRWLFYALESLELEKINFDSAVPGLSRELAYSLPLVFPPLHEQRRIAAYLDKTCAAIDTAIEKKQKQLETLDALRKSIIHKAVTRGRDDSVELKDSGVEWIGKIPAKWKLIAIKRIVSTKITDGPHETPELSDDGIQFVSAEAIKNHQIDFNLRRGFISLELHQQYCRKCKPQKRDIFIVKSGATTGNVAYVDVDFEFSIWSPLALVRCNEHIAFYKFIYYILLTDVFRKQVELSWSFGTQQNIGMRVIERIKIPIPPIEEQKKIAAFLDDETLRMSEIRANIESQISTLTAYRKSLIHECVTGKRRIE